MDIVAFHMYVRMYLHVPANAPLGIIPRAVAYLFNGIEERRRKAVRERRTPPSFEIHAQFLELYHEQIRDLFDHAQRMDGKGLHIHEDAFGNIYLKGATIKKITSEAEVRLFVHCVNMCWDKVEVNCCVVSLIGGIIGADHSTECVTAVICSTNSSYHVLGCDTNFWKLQ